MAKRAKATASRTTRKKKPSSEGAQMARAFGIAVRNARNGAFRLRKTLLVERDGWLVRVNKAGKVVRRVKRLEQIKLPAA